MKDYLFFAAASALSASPGLDVFAVIRLARSSTLLR